MTDNHFILDNKKLRSIIEKRLFAPLCEINKLFPPPLCEPQFSVITIHTEDYFILCFVDPDEKKRIDDLMDKNYYPFPGLICTEAPPISPIILENARNVIFHSCTAYFEPSFILKKDSTVILINYKQHVNTVEMGEYHYNIKLAYLISFGNELTFDNIYETIDELLAYSVKQWDRAKDF